MLWLAGFLLFVQADYTTEGMKALDEGRYDAAAAAFTKAIAADPKDYFAHFNLAMAYTLLNKDAEAVAEYRQTLAIKPEAAGVPAPLLLRAVAARERRLHARRRELPPGDRARRQVGAGTARRGAVAGAARQIERRRAVLPRGRQA